MTTSKLLQLLLQEEMSTDLIRSTQTWSNLTGHIVMDRDIKTSGP